MSHKQSLISERSFADTVEKVISAIEEQQFKVLHIHDVQATFTEKNITHCPYKIIEFCRAPAAKRVLDIDPEIGLFLPCRAIVYKLNDKVNISFMDPSIINDYHNAVLGSLPEEISQDIQVIINKLKDA